MRSILLYADKSPSMPARMASAIALARAYHGHITVLVDTPVARYLAMDALGNGFLAADAVKDAIEADEAFAQELIAQLEAQSVPCSLLRGEDEPGLVLCEAAALHDVLVLSRHCDCAAQVLVESGRPVWLVDEGAPTIPPPTIPPPAIPPRCIAIAWDGSRQSANALQAALPFLQTAQECHIITITEGDSPAPAGILPDPVAYLARQQIAATYQQIARTGSVEESLAARLALLAPDLLVMGGFGHSRWREYLLGGVTRYFLDQTAGPALLMMH